MEYSDLIIELKDIKSQLRRTFSKSLRLGKETYEDMNYFVSGNLRNLLRALDVQIQEIDFSIHYVGDLKENVEMNKIENGDK